MLRTRVVTAVALVICFLLALFFLAPLWWAIFTLAVLLLAGHEWSRLWKFEPEEEFGYLVAIAATGALILFVLPPNVASAPSYYTAVAFWFLGAPAWLYFGWKPVSKWIAALVGAVIFLATWLAMVDLRALGPLWLLVTMALVWVADISAYFAGRAFGRRKLAPAISPGKSWEGVFGGVAGVMLYATLIILAVQSVMLGATTHTIDARTWSALLALACIMGSISVVGDLFESAVKRLAGVKDSGAVLPGHGGILDRVDALLPVLPLAALIFTRNQ